MMGVVRPVPDLSALLSVEAAQMKGSSTDPFKVLGFRMHPTNQQHRHRHQHHSSNMWIIHDHFVVLGDKHRRANRTTTATEILIGLKEKYKSAHKGGQRKKWIPLAMDEFDRLLANKFPNLKDDHRRTVVVKCSGQAEQERVVMPNVFGYHGDDVATYGLGKWEESLSFYLHSRDPPTLASEISKHISSLEKLFARESSQRPPIKDIASFMRTLIFFQEKLDEEENGNALAQALLENLKPLNSLQKQWKFLEGLPPPSLRELSKNHLAHGVLEDLVQYQLKLFNLRKSAAKPPVEIMYAFEETLLRFEIKVVRLKHIAAHAEKYMDACHSISMLKSNLDHLWRQLQAHSQGRTYSVSTTSTTPSFESSVGSPTAETAPPPQTSLCPSNQDASHLSTPSARAEPVVSPVWLSPASANEFDDDVFAEFLEPVAEDSLALCEVAALAEDSPMILDDEELLPNALRRGKRSTSSECAGFETKRACRSVESIEYYLDAYGMGEMDASNIDKQDDTKDDHETKDDDEDEKQEEKEEDDDEEDDAVDKDGDDDNKDGSHDNDQGEGDNGGCGDNSGNDGENGNSGGSDRNEGGDSEGDTGKEASTGPWGGFCSGSFGAALASLSTLKHALPPQASDVDARSGPLDQSKDTLKDKLQRLVASHQRNDSTSTTSSETVTVHRRHKSALSTSSDFSSDLESAYESVDLADLFCREEGTSEEVVKSAPEIDDLQSTSPARVKNFVQRNRFFGMQQGISRKVRQFASSSKKTEEVKHDEGSTKHAFEREADEDLSELDLISARWDEMFAQAYAIGQPLSPDEFFA